MSDGSAEVQAAVYALLAGLDPPLASGGVHAPAPQGTPLPYVEIGESDAVQFDTQNRIGLDETLTIHVWTQPTSAKAAKEIMSRIRAALHGQNLVATGRASALMTVRDSRLFTDADGLSLHGVLSLRVIHHAE